MPETWLYQVYNLVSGVEKGQLLTLNKQIIKIQ